MPLEAVRFRLSGSGIRIFLVIWDPDRFVNELDPGEEPDPNENLDPLWDVVIQTKIILCCLIPRYFYHGFST